MPDGRQEHCKKSHHQKTASKESSSYHLLELKMQVPDLGAYDEDWGRRKSSADGRIDMKVQV